ncbi:hypothetical protein JYK14_02975 [Siccirubricoccus sp. KC 17139]|uniref:Transcription elongation factor GreA/GreB C-terminal domain-containing protein n=1 Tax=Siccirubricoccus soli TaxID=2899147 RepID=A0ABT1D295_9PROT|nr:hypothetical protein [Siccirubricoccus soli]MCO6415140.1 hypothetical protein [Siccirubricoccus soli]MCP2681271.1 hypothetical protein [Siccirubricoccus soli]
MFVTDTACSMRAPHAEARHPTNDQVPAKPTVDPGELVTMAAETLQVLSTVADKARSLLGRPSGDVPDVFTQVNTVNQQMAAINLGALQLQNQEDYRRQCSEPVVARIVAMEDDGTQRIFFVSRVSPVLSRIADASLLSYRAPLGRLASLPVGGYETIMAPRGRRGFEIIERAAFRPEQGSGELDARDARGGARTRCVDDPVPARLARRRIGGRGGGGFPQQADRGRSCRC